jgi:uncharacterized membrane protein
MKPKEFLNTLDENRITTAIQTAEGKSSGEIRVFVSRYPSQDPLISAQKEFVRLGMAKTELRNGVIIYFAPESKNFAIFGDIAVHEKCGEQFWIGIRDKMTDSLKNGQFTDAIVCAVTEVGNILQKHFPRQANDVNELPDTIARD